MKDPKRLEAEVLPRYYRHGHFTSFVRQLNFYNFKVRGWLICVRFGLGWVVVWWAASRSSPLDRPFAPLF